MDLGIKHVLTAEHFGGRRAFARHLLEYTKATVGIYAALRSVKWQSVERLVFVCEGNICRSPYAERRAGSMGYSAISAGLSAKTGTCADSRAVQVANLRGVDISPHRSTHFGSEALERGDLLLFFDPDHLYTVQSVLDLAQMQTSLLGLWASPMRPYVSDPYGKSAAYFQTCFSVIDSALDALAAKIPKAAMAQNVGRAASFG